MWEQGRSYITNMLNYFLPKKKAHKFYGDEMNISFILLVFLEKLKYLFLFATVDINLQSSQQNFKTEEIINPILWEASALLSHFIAKYLSLFNN